MTKRIKASRDSIQEVLDYYGDVSLEWLLSLPSTKEEAKEIGYSYYYNKQCSHGHIAPRLPSGLCIVCSRISNKIKYDKNPDKVNKLNASYQKKAYNENPSFRAATLIRSQLKRSLKLSKLDKITSSESILGYSSLEFKVDIESKFKEGVSWNNHGDLWELDHIKAVCHHTLETFEEIKLCNSLDNLQPLWINDHKEKTKLDLEILRINNIEEKLST